MSKYLHTSSSLLAIPLLLGLSVVPVFAVAQGMGSARASNGLPELLCGQSDCTLDYRRSAQTTQTPPSLAAANPNPVEAGPPPGQRLSWRGANYPACQSLGTGTNTNPIGQPSSVGTPIAAPYEYIKATDIPVPLGSTHATLLGTLSINLSGGPAGALGTVGFLQVRRSGQISWVNVDPAYAFSVRGYALPQSLWGKATYQGVSDLATLPGGTGVPDAVDARLAVFNVFTNDGGFSTVAWNGVCYGRMELTF